MNTPKPAIIPGLTDYSCNAKKVHLHGKAEMQQTPFARAPSKRKAMSTLWARAAVRAALSPC